MRTMRIVLSVIGISLIMAVASSAQATPVAVTSISMMPTDCNTVSFLPSDLQRADGRAAQVVMQATCPQDIKLFTQRVGSSQLVPAKPYQSKNSDQWLVPLPTMRPGQFYRLRLITKLDDWQHRSRVFGVSRVIPTRFAKHVNRPTATSTKQFFMDLSTNEDQITMVSRMRLKLTDGRLQRGSADLIGPTSRLVEFNPVQRDAKVDIGNPASGGFVFTDATTKPMYSVYIGKEFAG